MPTPMRKRKLMSEINVVPYIDVMLGRPSANAGKSRAPSQGTPAAVARFPNESTGWWSIGPTAVPTAGVA